MNSQEPNTSISRHITERNQMLCARAGLSCAVLMVIGWCALAQFIPPPSPNLSAAATADYWQHGTVMKMTGLVVALWGGTLYVPFIVGISWQMLRTGTHNRILAVVQGAAGIFATTFMTVPFTVMMAVAFRPDRPAELTQLLTDFGFIFALTTVTGFCLQNVVIGLAILQDQALTPVFPRWLAYFNFWLAFAFVPAALIPFFKTGPFAWNGVLSFWIPVGLFVAWIVVMSVMQHKAILANRELQAVSTGRDEARQGEVATPQAIAPE